MSRSLEVASSLFAIMFLINSTRSEVTMAIKLLQRLPHLFLRLVRIERLLFELSILNLQIKNVIYILRCAGRWRSSPNK